MDTFPDETTPATTPDPNADKESEDKDFTIYGDAIEALAEEYRCKKRDVKEVKDSFLSNFETLIPQISLAYLKPLARTPVHFLYDSLVAMYSAEIQSGFNALCTASKALKCACGGNADCAADADAQFDGPKWHYDFHCEINLITHRVLNDDLQYIMDKTCDMANPCSTRLLSYDQAELVLN